MNWYKIAKDFSERSLINNKIRYLKELKKILEKLSKLVFQSASITKKYNTNIIMSKKVSSYPNIRDILIEGDSIVMDNPWKFAVLCNEAIYRINQQICTLKKEKNEEKDKQKGWL